MKLLHVAAATLALAIAGAASAQAPAAPELDPESGLVMTGDWQIVKGYCAACHSTKLITQAGKTREGWIESIRWMQRTQGLWDLGPTEPGILDYLAANYGVKANHGRRKPLPPALMPPLPAKAS